MDLPFPLDDGEAVCLVVRRHWLAFWPRFFWLLCVAGLAPGFGVGLLLRNAQLSAEVWRIVVALAIGWIAFWLARAGLLKYRHDHALSVLTDRRLIRVRARAPFRLAISAIALEDIQDVRTRISGVAAMLFGCGDVECHTASGGLWLRQMPQPRELARRLQEACREARTDGATNRTPRWNTQALG